MPRWQTSLPLAPRDDKHHVTHDGSFRLGDIVLRHDDVVPREQVLAWHADGHVWDTAQGWFVNAELALKPTPNGFRVVELARLRDDD